MSDDRHKIDYEPSPRRTALAWATTPLWMKFSLLYFASMSVIAAYSYIGIKITLWRFDGNAIFLPETGTSLPGWLFISLPGTCFLLCAGVWTVVGTPFVARRNGAEGVISFLAIVWIGVFAFAILLFPLWDDASP